MKKYKFIRNMVPAAMAALLTIAPSSCSDELNLSIQDPQTDTQFDANGMLAKIYSSLSITGQTGGSGNPDMSQFDEGNSAFYRRIFEASELCSDECIWTWQGDTGIPELTNISWNSSHGYNELTYYRIMYNITLCNSYLDQTDGMDRNAQLNQNRAEVRFMRALFLSYFVDLYGKAPFKEHVNTDLPIEYSRKQAFDYIVSELKSINGEDAAATEQLLDFTGDDANYGRADKVAANMLLARMYLNAEVYIGEKKYKEAADYATKVIDSNYKLYDDDVTNPYPAYTRYEQLFMGDNGENAAARKEIILPIRCDGATSRSYGGSIYVIASTTGDGTPDQGLPSSMWTCNRARQAGVNLFFEAGTAPLETDVKGMVAAARDDRAMFYSVGRTYETEEKTTFKAGFAILKWTNVRANGSTPNDVTFPDTDIPFMRVAEAYLTRAEANYRLHGVNADVMADINKLRSRAHAQTKNTIADEREILDEWGREFYFEGRRRTDLIRFGVFTSEKYVWDWKGGVYAGAGVQSKFNIYPIPYAETSTNHNMQQNSGY